MNKVLPIIVLSLFLTACDQSKSGTTTDISLNRNNLPEGLKDCKFYHVYVYNSSDLNIIRCPNSTVSNDYTIQQGKSSVPVNTIIIDGNTYVEQRSKSTD